MSKKNRKRYRDMERPAQSHIAVSPTQTYIRPQGNDVSSVHAAEYKIITKDMIRLVALNGFMLAAVIVVYFTNKSSGYLERFFENIL
jgi:hypothetical protein